MIEWPRFEPPRKGRGGRRRGAGRKPNRLKCVLTPLTAKEIIARRHPLSERLSPEELAMLHALTKKLAEPFARCLSREAPLLRRIPRTYFGARIDPSIAIAVSLSGLEPRDSTKWAMPRKTWKRLEITALTG